MKMTSKMAVLALMWVLGAVTLAAAPATPAERLRASESAGERCRYQAIFVCTEVRGATTKTATVEISHRPNATRYAYQAPELRGVVVIEGDGNVIRLNPADQTATRIHVPRKHSGLDLLLANYSVDMVRGDKVAGRPTEVLEIRHKTSGLLRRRIWLDQEHDLVLRSEEYDRQGQIRSRTECQSIRWQPELEESLFQIPPGWRTVEAEVASGTPLDTARLAEAVGFDVVLPKAPPSGYVQDEISLYPCPCGAKAVQVRYTDGLASCSLFIKTATCSGGGRGQGMGPGMGMGMGKGPLMGKGQGQGRGRGWGAQGEGRVGGCACERMATMPGQAYVKRTARFTYILAGDVDEALWKKFLDDLP